MDPASEARFWSGIAEVERFFKGEARVQAALRRLAAELDAAGVPYAIVGALAVGAHGHVRATSAVDVLLTAEGLAALKARVLGRGWVEKFPGSRGLRDTIENVAIDVILSGDYPGDGQPKSVAFPDPEQVALRGEHAAILLLPRLIELKLASGMTAPHRLQDLADVIGLVRSRGLGVELADELDPYVRPKFLELWQAAQVKDAE